MILGLLAGLLPVLLPASPVSANLPAGNWDVGVADRTVYEGSTQQITDVVVKTSAAASTTELAAFDLTLTPVPGQLVITDVVGNPDYKCVTDISPVSNVAHVTGVWNGWPTPPPSNAGGAPSVIVAKVLFNTVGPAGGGWLNAITMNPVSISIRDQTGTEIFSGVVNNMGINIVAAPPLPPPTIASISPNVAEQGKTLELSISGTNFADGAKVFFSPPTGITATSVKFVSHMELKVTIIIAKDAPIGSKDVTVTNPDGHMGTLTGVFTVKAGPLPPITGTSTTTRVRSLANPSVSGQSVTFTATVTSRAGTPTGTVTFKDEETTLGTETLDGSGRATYATTSLSVGRHSICAVYGGDSNFNGSTSSLLRQRVNKAKTATTVSSSLNPSVSGQSVIFTATVRARTPGSGTPTGTVTFKDGRTTLATVALAGSGQATYATTSLSVRTYSITAVYGGDSNFNGSTSSRLRQSTLSSGHPYACEEDLIEVMFAHDSKVRLRNGALVDLATNALTGVDGVLQKLAWFEWYRISDVPEERVDEIQAHGQANTGKPVYNLNNIYRLRIPKGLDVWAISQELEALPGIMLARPVPKPMPLPTPPNYVPNQGYLRPASSTPAGIDAEYAWTQQPGGNGAGVTVCDLEYSWNYNHADITKAKAVGCQINSNVSDPYNDNNHGTAVIGELVSDNNGWGTTGICYGASLKTCGTYEVALGWNVDGAILTAIDNLKAGDVILLEQQWVYYDGSGRYYIPIEWWADSYQPNQPQPNSQSNNAVYVTIVNAVSNGIHVVEAGGNGDFNTDNLKWAGDSGAIIVGAGGAYPGGTWREGALERLSFSSYGSRFDLQGWGENVVTTGYGDLYKSEGVNYLYTNTFDGTSSASPIVAGAVAAVQGNRLKLGLPTLSPRQMRSLLVNTGTPQKGTRRIGPLPNLAAALSALAATP